MLRDRTTILAFLGIVFAGGFNAIAIKLSNPELPPFWGAALRLMIAAAVMFVLVYWRGVALPRGRTLVGSVLFGLLNFAAFLALMYWGLRTVPAGFSMVVLASAPLLTLLLAVVHRLEKFRLLSLVGAVVALAGIALIASQRVATQQFEVVGLLAIIGAAFAMAETNVVVKLFPRAHPLANNAVAMAVGVVVLLVLSVVDRETWVIPQQPQTWVALAYLSIIGSVALFLFFLIVIERWSASATSYALLLMPLVSVLGAAVLLGETITAVFVVGVLIVLAGVYVGAFRPSLAHPLPGIWHRQPKLATEAAVAEGPPTLVAPPCP